MILINNESSADVLFKSTLNKNGPSQSEFEPVKLPFDGFTGDSVHSKKVLTLPVELGFHSW